MKQIAYIISLCLITNLIYAMATPYEKGVSRIREIEMELLTYSYANPREYIEPGRMYPYHRFDGYTPIGEMKKWKMVELENDYLKVWILPAIGGKVWGAIDKKTGKEFLYFNHVVKFRDVSSRGPWTSGGLEMNFGIIGHSPWCSSQVDYDLQTKANGDVVCTVGGIDISLGTDWRVQISLPTNKAVMKTEVTWYNSTPYEKPFYQWMNAGIKTEGDLQYYYPGSEYLTHDGQAMPWPKEKEHRIDHYEENNFGHYKSYHVTGKCTDFWGAYWHKDSFGMAHVSPYQDKLGKKIWIWGLSRYGMVWEDLLTDKDGQYTEVQSGKLFNQSIGTSYKTPFKHYSFHPGQTYQWKEYWLPIQKIGGIDFCNEELAYHIEQEGDISLLHLYAVAPLRDSLIIRNKKGIIYQTLLNMNPTEVQVLSLPSFDTKGYRIYKGNVLVYSSQLNDTPLNRPQKLPIDFDHSSAYGYYLQGKEFERQNFRGKAEGFYLQSLKKETYYAPSLIGLAGIYLQQNKTLQAETLLRKALQVNTYDAKANYLYAFANMRLNKVADAMDGFSVAMQSPLYASIAAEQIAYIYIQQASTEKAIDFIERSLRYNSQNIGALQAQLVLYRLNGQVEQSKKAIETFLSKDPLNDVALYEQSLLIGDINAQKKFTNKIINEYWYKNYQHLARFYKKMGQLETAIKILQIAPVHPQLQYEQAYYLHLLGKEEQAKVILNLAEIASPSLIFPNEVKDEALYKWVQSTGYSAWKAQYFLALLYLNFERKDEAIKAFDMCGMKPDFYAFYLTRGLQIEQESDFLKAIELASERFVGYQEMAKWYLNKGKAEKAVAVLESYRKQDKNNSYINLLLAKAYLEAKQYNNGIRLMNQTKVLPNEGSIEGRNVWRESHLRYAIQWIEKGQLKKAKHYIKEAKRWPENLGVGKPYNDSIDERLEQFLQVSINQLDTEKKPLYAEIQHHSLIQQPEACVNLFTLLLLRKSGQDISAQEYLKKWKIAFPTSQGRRWAEAIYQGDTVKAKQIIESALVYSTTLPFQIIFEDRDLKIIKENYLFFERLICLF